MLRSLQNSRSYFYLLSFLEGGAVMGCELVGAKLLAPYFGTSLYVWAAALGITLGGLMLGYFFGGRLTMHLMDKPVKLYWTLALSGTAFSIMPLTSHWIMDQAIHLPLQWGALLSLGVFMLPPLFGMGMVSPMIIHLLTKERIQAGNQAGNVYAISTLGGILTTFLFGFFLIPTFGVSTPAYLGGIGLAMMPMLSLLRRKRWWILVLPLLWVLIVIEHFGSINIHKKEDSLLYQSEGLLGQMEVREWSADAGYNVRALFVNHTMQTVLNLKSDVPDYWPYTQRIQTISEHLPKGQRALVLGMGAGMVTERLSKYGFEVHAVDIDARLANVARTYFGLDTSKVKIIIGDVRHYLRTSKEKYDLIVFDVFKGESAPSHMLTMEGIEDAGNRLDPSGLILLNFYGYLDGSLGELARKVALTFDRAGYMVRLMPTPGGPDERNVVFALSKDEEQLSLIDRMCDREGWTVLKPSDLDTEGDDPEMLTDDRPREDLYSRPAARWRSLYLLQPSPDHSNMIQ